MIVLDSQHLLDGLVTFMLVSVRISAMLMAAPMFSTSSVSVPIRITIALSIAALMLQAIPIPKIDLMSPAGALALVSEAIIGIAIGFLFQMAFAAVALMGEQVSSAMGLGFAAMMDPSTGTQSPVITQFMTVMMLLIFMTLEGPHILLKQLAASFSVMPIGGAVFRPDALINLIKAASLLFSAALLISIPLVLGLFLITLLIGMLTRVAPQLNLFSVGFPITIIAGLVLLLVSIPNLAASMAGLVDQAATAANSIILTGTRNP